MSRITRFGVSLPDELLKQFDELIEKKDCPTRSKAIADIIREELKRDSVKSGKKGTGVIVLVYDHHKRELVNKLTDMQHDFSNMVICSQHIHLDHHNCMEVIAVKGTYRQMQALADKLKSTKGVNAGELTVAEMEDNK